jgi:hypothetical protein
MMIWRVSLLALFVSASVNADPAIHRFSLWKQMTPAAKVDFYRGWTNGFLEAKGSPGDHFARCLYAISYEKAIAVIDKRFNDHPERWSNPIGPEILEAFTEKGGPCEGKNPLTTDSN